MRKQTSVYSRKDMQLADSEMSKEQSENLRDIFIKRKDSSDYMSLYNAVVVMKELGFTIDEDTKLEIVTFLDSNFLKLEGLKRLYNFLNKKNKKVEKKEQEDSDFIEAFVAVGGAKDCENEICIENMKTIFKDFNIGLSLDSLMEKNHLTGKSRITYEEFCRLFSDNILEKSKNLFTLISVRFSYQKKN